MLDRQALSLATTDVPEILHSISMIATEIRLKKEIFNMVTGHPSMGNYCIHAIAEDVDETVYFYYDRLCIVRDFK